MLTKVCTKCGIEKDLNEFRPSLEGKFGRTSYCKKCLNEQIKQYCIENPWLRTLNNIKQRCENKNNTRYYQYGERGIKCLITANELKELWFRDKAYLMKRPSIDRIDNDGNYEFSNCRFLEFKENSDRAIEKQKTPILQYDLQGNFIREWESIAKIRKELNYSIDRCLSGERKHCYKFVWKYKNQKGEQNGCRKEAKRN